MIAINFPTSPLQYQSEPKEKKNQNGAIMSNAATKAGYGSNILTLEDGYYSGKLLHGESEVWYPDLYPCTPQCSTIARGGNKRSAVTMTAPEQKLEFNEQWKILTEVSRRNRQ